MWGNYAEWTEWYGRIGSRLFACAAFVLTVFYLLLWIAKKDRDAPCSCFKVTPGLGALGLVSAQAALLCGMRWLEILRERMDMQVLENRTAELAMQGLKNRTAELAMQGLENRTAELAIQGSKVAASQLARDILELGGYAMLAILAACLLMACVTDCSSCVVYHYVWWVAGAAVVFFWLTSVFLQYCSWQLTGTVWKMSAGIVSGLMQIIIIILLQEKLFCRMYGRADCHAFLVCGIAECAMGFGVKEHLVQMLLAVSGLAVVQGMRRNIKRNGNLKKPVPFLPYITVSFWLTMLIL